MELRYQPYFNTSGSLWKVTVIPQKDTTKHVAADQPAGTNQRLETVVMIPANLRTGCLVIQNLGRYPIVLPSESTEDLRPMSFYVAGVGSQDVKVINRHNRQEYFVETLNFP